MKTAQLICHLGLGDLILTSAIAEWLLLDGYEKIYYPCRPQDEASIRSFFFLTPGVEVYIVQTESTTPPYHEFLASETKFYDATIIGIGFYAGTPMDAGISFGEAFYQQLSIPYSVRFDYSPIPPVVEKYYDINISRFLQHVLVHDDWLRGYKIKAKYIDGFSEIHIKPSNSSCLAYAPLIKKSRRILAIDSFLIHLVDSLPTDAKLYYHKYARPRNHRWNDIDTPTKYSPWIVINE